MTARFKTSPSSTSDDALSRILSQLPTLPSTVRYYDEFDEKLRSIKDFQNAGIAELQWSGGTHFLDFSRFEPQYGEVLKHLFFMLISQEYCISTAYHMICSFSHIPKAEFAQLVETRPTTVRAEWAVFRVKSYNHKVYVSLKAILRFLCFKNIDDWSPAHLGQLGTLPLPATDKYAAARNGDVFLSVEEEATLVHHFDELAHALKSYPASVSDDAIRGSGALLCCYLFGMRPEQIALVRLRDVRIWTEVEGEPPTVHITFQMIKQRSKSKCFPLTRRVKYDWAPIIVHQYNRMQARSRQGPDHLFDVNSSSAMSQLIIKIASSVTGVDVSATDLRHTAAQRLVDAGASQEDLATFMGHSDVTTGLFYFQTSANQAERINAALGISDIYLRVAKIAHDKFISPEELAELKEDQQIAGVPHGIPISGIGGCATGQPSCPFNPITSCYGCRKFLPVTDVTLHKKVLQDMRGVVIDFETASHGDTSSPAYLQLRRTISAVQTVIDELEPNA